ncbi:MFS transporter [Nonomuraea wenchangensis]|uniref:Transmembrane secretion effector n=1 Tax=Nonomuraea wenchangensis TaxID=568860 RepID=A0A1H9Z046_9ACTN|nr:MFS transporter [Nonomuraea wenchangensis]SES74822.1 Transmembrane secretion effector [Nonomuraea wenchangensis]
MSGHGLGRPFAFLWSSTALSNLADGVLKVGAPLLAVSMTRSPTLVSLVGAAATLPWLLLALPAGAVADRADRRHIMAGAGAVRAVALAVAALLAASGTLDLWVLLAAVLAAGVAEVFADTSAQAVLPMTVPASQLTRANGRVSSAQQIGNEFAGAPVAGLLVGLLPAAVFGAPALLYAAAAALLLGMRGTYRPTRNTPPGSAPAEGTAPDSSPAGGTTPHDSPAGGTTPHDSPAGGTTPDSSPAANTTPGSGPAANTTPNGSPAASGPGRRASGRAPSGPLLREIGEALRFLLAHRVLRSLAITAGLLNLANSAYFAVFVLWAVGDGSAIGLPPEGYGLMMTAFAAGAVLGSLLAERIAGIFGEFRALTSCWLASSLLLLVPVVAPSPWALYPTAVLWGVCGAAANVLVISTRQRLIPPELLGRVNSAYRLVGMGGMPLGAALGGVVAEFAGLPAVLLGSIGVCLLGVGLVRHALADRISRPLTSSAALPDITRSL